MNTEFLTMKNLKENLTRTEATIDFFYQWFVKLCHQIANELIFSCIIVNHNE